MNDASSRSHALCPNCGYDQNEDDAIFCLGCGSRLGSELLPPPAPPKPHADGEYRTGSYVLDALLWTAPTYNAYSGFRIEDANTSYTIIERAKIADNVNYPTASLSSPTSDAANQPAKPDKAKKNRADDTVTEPDRPSFDLLGLLRPMDFVTSDDHTLVAFRKVQGQPIAHVDQMGEKEALQIGVQLCNLADSLHRAGLVHNSLDPYSIVLGPNNRVSIIGFDRIRTAGESVANLPIYPSRGYTPPELFEQGSTYQPTADVYAIAAVLQFLLTGERIESGEGAAIYPIATVAPGFERLLNRALADDPAKRFQTAGEFGSALRDLTLPTILRSGNFTDVGLVRELNEDSILALDLTQYYESVQTQIGLYIVSDGMGGEAAGEVASRVTVRAVAEWITEKLISASLRSTNKQKIAAPTMTGGLRLAVADGNAMATTEMLKKAVMNANNEVLAYANAHPGERGLGATVTAAMIVGEILTIAHVGDSRCYLLSGEKLQQLTEDHSLVQRMVNTGNLSRSEARVHPYRNVIYRSIGGDQEIEIDVIRRTLSSQDVVLLCSDGLNGMLSDDEIRDILMVNPDPTAAAKELVVSANAAGGEDNTSVIVVRML
ncbi:MAG TPA: Stp1/IreP family PP2C-type Ser/Thr phosphatase [Blastocatellia bacterium]|nr:Stp1/IreP family PP2C-type Ser/Thr phosphatase [Blastocatellia bacterium]